VDRDADDRTDRVPWSLQHRGRCRGARMLGSDPYTESLWSGAKLQRGAELGSLPSIPAATGPSERTWNDGADHSSTRFSACPAASSPANVMPRTPASRRGRVPPPSTRPSRYGSLETSTTAPVLCSRPSAPVQRRPSPSPPGPRTVGTVSASAGGSKPRTDRFEKCYFVGTDRTAASVAGGLPWRARHCSNRTDKSGANSRPTTRTRRPAPRRSSPPWQGAPAPLGPRASRSPAPPRGAPPRARPRRSLGRTWPLRRCLR
jgi:hypothetical protein